MAFQKFRTGLKSPVVTPEEGDYPVSFQQYVSNSSQPIPMPVNQYVNANFMNSTTLQRYNMMRNQLQQQAANIQDLSQFVSIQQSPVNSVPPMHIPNQNENMGRGLPQFPQQRNAMYNTIDPLRNLVPKPVKVEHIPPPPQQQPPPQRQRIPGFLAPTFTGLQQQPQLQRNNVANANRFIMQNQQQNPPTAFQANPLQPRTMPPSENHQTYPPDLSADVQSILNNPKAISMLQAHKEDFNPLQSPYLYTTIGRSPDGSNNTSSTSSPTPGMKIVSKASPHAGSRAIGRPPFPSIDSLTAELQKMNDPLLRSLPDQQALRYMTTEVVYRSPHHAPVN